MTSLPPRAKLTLHYCLIIPLFDYGDTVWSDKTGLPIRLEIDGDILKVDGYGGRRPAHMQGVWGWPMRPAGYRGRAPLVVQGAKPPEAK